MEDIDFDLDVEQAFLQGYETPGVDFKAPGPWREKPVEEACSLIKDLIAFANYGGGLIIIGVTELSDRGFQFDGLSDDDCSTWEQTRVSNFLDERVEPRLRFRVTTVMREGKKFKVIKVLPFDDLPHMCVRREAGELRRMTLYVRNDKTESAPVRTPAEMNRIIERAVINRGDRLLQSMHSILRGAAITPEADSAELFATEVAQADEQGAPGLPTSWGPRRGFRKVMWYPARYDMERFGLQELRKALEHASAPLRGWPFLYLRQGATSPRNFQHGVEAENAWQHPHWTNVQHYQYWCAYTSGAFYQRAMMSEDSDPVTRDRSLWADETAIYVSEALTCMVRMCETLRVEDEDVTFQTNLEGIKDRLVASASFARRLGDDSDMASSVDSVQWKGTKPIEEWRAGLVNIGTDITVYLLNRCNWNDVPWNGIRTIIFDTVSGRLR